MDINVNELVGQCMNQVQSRFKNLNTLNIVVIGKTGVGKSTLINTIFRGNLATTGIGRPVTQQMRKYTKEGFPLAIYDTKGFELGKNAQEEVRDEILATIKEGVESRDVNKAIHCIWYCVNGVSGRFEEEESRWIRDFTEKNSQYQVPIIIVVTQSYFKKKAEDLKRMIEKENLDVIQVVPILAQSEEEEGIEAFGLETLIEVMQEALPEELRDTLMNVQQVNLKLKQKKSQAAVATAALTAAAMGATPIPFSDATLLIPTELTMLASITVIFGFDIDKAVLTSLVTSIVGVGGATITGKTIVTNVFKLVPGLGSLVGGAISGATASLLTTALGEAYIGIMTAMFNGEIKENELSTKEGREKFAEMFKANLKKYKKI